MKGARFARAARSFIGAPFRLQGRNRERGLDCVGLVSAALHEIGQPHRTPESYSLRNLHAQEVWPMFAASGFAPASQSIEAGDLLLTKPGPGQLHLMIATGMASFIHAHAGLGRVVETPGPPQYPLLFSWRLLQD